MTEPGEETMSLVSGIEALTGGRCLVTLEDGRSFPLYQKELEQFGVREGEELAPESERVILEELLPKRARLCAMNYLQRMDRTEQQLRRKLAELFYPEEIAEQAVAYVKSFHYIDDVRYAGHYLECRKGSRSLRRIEQELYQRGVSREDFQEALSGTDAPDEESQIRAWLEKKHYSGAGADRRETERMMRFLLGKGYSMSEIRIVLLDIASKTV